MTFLMAGRNCSKVSGVAASERVASRTDRSSSGMLLSLLRMQTKVGLDLADWEYGWGEERTVC